MSENPWANNPFISAFLLSAAAALMMFCGYFYFDGVPDSPKQLQVLLWRTIAGGLLWIAGCGAAARTRNASWRIGLLWGLLFVPGLLVLLRLTGGKNRQEIWQESNPQLVGKQLRRQHRDIKALY